jgi:hypothetical protein
VRTIETSIKCLNLPLFLGGGELKNCGKLIGETADFALMNDTDFQISGIDIVARRQEKLQRDQAAAAEHHSHRRGALAMQVQSLLDEVGLTPIGREYIRVSGIPRLSALRALDTGEKMRRCGLGIVDRQQLELFLRTERAREVRKHTGARFISISQESGEILPAAIGKT